MLEMWVVTVCVRHACLVTQGRNSLSAACVQLQTCYTNTKQTIQANERMMQNWLDQRCNESKIYESAIRLIKERWASNCPGFDDR